METIVVLISVIVLAVAIARMLVRIVDGVADAIHAMLGHD